MVCETPLEARHELRTELNIRCTIDRIIKFRALNMLLTRYQRLQLKGIYLSNLIRPSKVGRYFCMTNSTLVSLNDFRENIHASHQTNDDARYALRHDAVHPQE